MHTDRKVKNEKIKRFSHLLAGMIILLHGYERLESGHASHIFFFAAGIIFLLVAIFHHRLAEIFPLIDSVFFFIEATLSFVIAYEYFEAGKHALPFVYLMAGTMQILAIFILYRKNKRSS